MSGLEMTATLDSLSDRQLVNLMRALISYEWAARQQHHSTRIATVLRVLQRATPGYAGRTKVDGEWRVYTNDNAGRKVLVAQLVLPAIRHWLDFQLPLRLQLARTDLIDLERLDRKLDQEWVTMEWLS